MGLFGTSSIFDVDIEKATSENNTTDQWGLIMEICDRVGGSSANAKECLRTIMKRLAHNDPHVAMQAVTLLDACMSNCGKTFHLEVASREFETEVQRLMPKLQYAVANKLGLLVQKWAKDKDITTDPQLKLILHIYMRLLAEKKEWFQPATTTEKAPQPVSKDPNVVSSQQEMDDLAKAIELSLKESPMKHAAPSSAAASTTTSKSSVPTSLYPTTALDGNNFNGAAAAAASSQARKVRALYDFEAAEDNELNFIAGDIIHVTDDSDPNWWKGYNQRGEGLFPASFVTADLSVEPESMRFDLNKKATSKKSVQFVDDLKREQDHKDEPVTVNEVQLDRLLHLLHEANPEDPSTDTDEMLKLENVVNQMGPLIDTELERVDRTHAQLTRLTVGLVDAFNLYHTLMRESEKPHFMGGYSNPQAAYGGHLHGMPGQYAMGGPQPMPNMMMNPAAMYSQQTAGGMPGMNYNMAPGIGGPPVQHNFAMGPPPPMMDPSATTNHSSMNHPGGMHPQQMVHNVHQIQQGQQPHPAVSGIVMGAGQQPQSPVMAHQQNGHAQHGQHPNQPQLPHVANTTTSNSIGGGPITNPGYPPVQQQQQHHPHEDPALAQGINYHQQQHLPQQGQLPGGPLPPHSQQQQQQMHPGMQLQQQQQYNSVAQPTQFPQPGNGDGNSPHHVASLGHLNHHPISQHDPNVAPQQQHQQQMPANYSSPMFSGPMNMQPMAVVAGGGGMPMGSEMNNHNPIYQQR